MVFSPHTRPSFDFERRAMRAVAEFAIAVSVNRQPLEPA
jgi:hypothetical protein